MTASWGLYAQTDTLTLANGRVLVGSYKVSFTAREVEGRTNAKEIYMAKDVKGLSTATKRYRSVNIDVKGEPSYYMADRRLDSEVDLYAIDFRAGHFNENSVPQSFFYFERDGELTYVNKTSLEAFYSIYFGNCSSGMPTRSLVYNETSIVKALNDYNRCLNPASPQKVQAPVLTSMILSVHGGVANLTHYPLNVAFNNGHFKDKAKLLGLGVEFFLKNKFKLGLAMSLASHSVTSPIFVAGYGTTNSPLALDMSYQTLGLGMSGAYVLRFNKLTLSPGASIGFSKQTSYSESQQQPNIYIRFQPYTIDPDAEDQFVFKELFYDIRAYADLSYELGSSLAVFARGGFNLTLTKSLAVGFEGNHAIDGMMVALGLSYTIKK